MKTMLAVLMLLAAGPAGAADSTQSDDSKPGALTPFGWKRPAPPPGPQVDSQGVVKPKLKDLSPAPAADADEIVCEKDLVHPTKPVTGDFKQAVAANPLGMAIGIQHCWKKSDPSQIIERPYSMTNLVQEAVKSSIKLTPRLEGGRFPKTQKRGKAAAPRAKPQAQAAAVAVSTAPAAPLPPPPAEPGEGAEGIPVRESKAAPLLR